jgi:hypothetical protein
MKIPFLFRPSLFNLLFFTEPSSLDVGTSSPSAGALANEALEGSSPSDTEPSVQSQGSVIATDDQTQTAGNPDPLEGLPTLEELQTQASQNIPYAKALAQLRPAYESIKAAHDTVNGQFQTWKDPIEKIGDPIQAQYYHDVFSGLHQPVVDPSSGQAILRNGQPVYSSEAALMRMEQEQPGIVDEIYGDLLKLRIPDENNRVDTLENHYWRAKGLDPNRLDDYRNIDARSSGIVTAEQLKEIPEAYHSAFKSLPESLRLAWPQLDDAEKQYHLNTANAAIKAQELEDRINRDQQAQQQQRQQEMEQRIATKQEESLSQVTRTIYDSINTNLASQIKFSEADPTLNDSLRTGVMAQLYVAIDPAGYFLVEPQFKALGINMDFPDAKWHDVIEQFSMKDSEAVRLAEEGQVAFARQARGQANQLQSRIVAKLNSVGLQLAQRAAGHAVTRPAQQNNGPVARTVVNGNGYQGNGNANPYLDNPHPFGSPEYKAFNRQLDKQLYNAANT